MVSDDFATTTEKGEKPYDSVSSGKLDHEHVYSLVTSDEVGWQAVIYDLINTEQLNPWNLDLIALSKKYLIKNLTNK